MSKNYSLKPDGTFVIKNYNTTNPFSNFLPGIAGEWGIPLWVFYVNRGQGVVSFGIADKDHSITEFLPANKAYEQAANIGFRTFLKTDKCFYEPFAIDSCCDEEMSITSSSLSLAQSNEEAGLCVGVKYFTLPNSSVGALVRKLMITNISKKKIKVSAIDGLPKIVPFGSINFFLKDMSRTLEAWMDSSTDKGLALFRLIVDPKDVAHTRFIEGANFNYSFYQEKGKKVFPYMIVDPRAVFDQDTTNTKPYAFIDKSFKTPLNQISVGRTPCSFSSFTWNLNPGQSKTLYSTFGASFKRNLIKKNVKIFTADFLNKKDIENDTIIDNLKDHALSVSNSKEFDNYVGATYLDNVLRGGFPYSADINGGNQRGANKNTYYIYSRKHGDLERDYNYFQLLPSYFSEGQANYRDINQNRRMDLFFNPALNSQNIHYFFNFLKIDGYNPLVVKGEKLIFEKVKAQNILNDFKIKDVRLLNLMAKGFHLGEFFKLMDEEGIKITRKKELLSSLLSQGKRVPQASHQEGYWIDHWQYNLDLIENFLSIYPDKLKELFTTNNYFFWDEEYSVKPRFDRYLLRHGKVYQGESLEVVKEKKSLIKERKSHKHYLRTKSGKIYRTNLTAKLISLILNKAATLDPDGIGIEMEADKPGWCDSLNGLPALFGSSICQTFELKRMALMIGSALKQLRAKGVEDVALAVELGTFLDKLHKTLKISSSMPKEKRDYYYWNQANFAKEDFRAKTKMLISGRDTHVSIDKLEDFLNDLVKKLNIGISRSKDKKTGLPLTYFTYTVKKYIQKHKRIIPQSFIRHALPLSLEGIMHSLKVEGKKEVISKAKKSPIYDKAIKMYRLNDSYKNESLEIGRSRVFVPGWLENESVWLHMQYKYLLEMLKNGFYEEFFTDFHNCAVCFSDPKTYGRNILENSSFIVSSAYPDKNLWGKGFVARLSGATVELLNIWAVMCLGQKPFFMDRGSLKMRFEPILKKQLFTKKATTTIFRGKKIVLAKDTFSFKLFSNILVTYHNPKRKDTYSASCLVDKMVISIGNMKIVNHGDILKSPVSGSIRRQEADRIDIYLK